MAESRRPDPSELLDSRRLERAPAPPLDPELPKGGQLVGEHALTEQIGAGGFSIVWRAKNQTTGQIVALKLPRVPEFVAHLTREALMNARFQDRQVVPVLDIRLDNRPPFLVMPFVEGHDLLLPDAAP